MILAYNGEAIKDGRDLARDVANTNAGQTANLTVWREGHERTVAVAIGNHGDGEDGVGARTGKPGARRHGSWAAVARRRGSSSGSIASAHGVVVANVVPGSRADESGVQEGD